MNYTLFVDESGQSGIVKTRSGTSGGASRYMTLGGVLVPNAHLVQYRLKLADLAGEFGKPELHCSKLNHNQIVRFAQELSGLQVLLFGVISLKETLGLYKEEIGASDKMYYNKCAQYLLERVGHFMGQNGLTEDDISVCFEEGNFDYSKLRGLIAACRRKPFRPASKHLKNINPQSIYALPKSSEALLQASDLVAHSLFRLVDDGPSSFGVFETRYIAELRHKFHNEPGTGVICGTGIFAVHKLSDIKASDQTQEFLETLTV